jgi:hypothetical protein
MLLRNKKIFGAIAFYFCINFTFAQTTFTTTGNWNSATNWAGSNIGDNISEDVVIDNSQVAFIPTGLSYTVGNLTLGNSSGITIDASATLNVGQSGTPMTMTANNNGMITVAGSMTLWGDLIVNNDLSWNITGSVVIKGDVLMRNNSAISVSGSLVIEGDFTSENQTNFTITGGGSVIVGGTVTVGNDSNLTGPPGSFVSGGCSQGSGSNWCSGGVLPVKLLYFDARIEGDIVSLVWATEKVEAFDRFEIEKAAENLVFFRIAEIFAQAGYSSVIQRYSYIDHVPYSGLNYYRLKAIDLDGTFEYFNIEFINYKGQRNLEVFSNPVTSELRLNVPFSVTPQDIVSLIDMQGTVIMTSAIRTSGIHVFSLGEQVKPGSYILKYHSPGFLQTVKVVVKR